MSGNEGHSNKSLVPINDSESPSNSISLDDIIDLTIVELYILNFLVRIGGSAVRFAVFNELNSKLERNKVSRSSFYHSLKRLETKEFVAIKPNPKGKGSLVAATSRARQAVKRSNIFSIWGNIDLNEITLSIVRQLKIELDDEAHSQLLINMDEMINTNILERMADLISKMYILADEELIETLLSRNLSFPISKIEKGVIDVSDNFFDRGIIINFHPSVQKFGIIAPNLINEIIRVEKPNGQIIIIAYDEFPRTNNLILDSVMKDLLEEAIHTHISKETLEQLMLDAGIVDIIFHRPKGSIIAIGRKKSN